MLVGSIFVYPSSKSQSIYYFVSQRSADHRDLHSFPTRRSSDLDMLFAGEDEQSLHRKARSLAGQRGVDLVANESAAGSDRDRKSTRLNSSHMSISYAVFCLKKKKSYRLKNII